MLQKMFPENGKCVPKIRFSGFSDDWEQRKVSEIGNIVTGSTPKKQVLVIIMVENFYLLVLLIYKKIVMLDANNNYTYKNRDSTKVAR